MTTSPAPPVLIASASEAISAEPPCPPETASPSPEIGGWGGGAYYLRVLLLSLVLCPTYFAPQASGQERVLDDFESLAGWSAITPEGVVLALSLDEGAHGRALRMDYDFQSGGGYAIARRALPLDLPANYRFRFTVRAESAGGGPAPVNDLEFKLVDESGENVWWHNRRRLRFPTEWTRLASKKRHIGFAWGPAGGGDLAHVAAVEFVVAAVEGGRGTVWLDDFTFEPLPADAPYTGTPAATATAGDAAAAVDGDPATAWVAPAGAQALTLDFGREREFGGLVLTWGTRHAPSYEVETSSDGAAWATVARVRSAQGGRDYVPMPEAEARFVRLALPAGAAELGEMDVQPLAFSETPNGLFEAMARSEAPGRFPRMFLGEQTYWTIVGADGDEHEALVSEDGAVEVAKGRFSVEPFLFRDGRLLGWLEADSTSHSLQDGYLPIPSATRHYGPLRLTTTAFADGTPGRARLVLRYRLANAGGSAARARLFLAARPFQVNPPTQWLNTPGGAGRIARLVAGDGAFEVDGWTFRLTTSPDAAGATTFAAGDVTEWLARGVVPPSAEAADSDGYASGALAYDLVVPAGGSEEIVLTVPMAPDEAPAFPPHPSRAEATSTADHWQEAVAASWRAKLDRVRFVLPPEAEALGHTLRSQLAYVLINRDGGAIHPGSRSYERSWIRDGSLTSSALLRMGYPEAAEAFARWYAPYQFASGKVPCCVDRRGPDPTFENDSHGQLPFLIAEVHRFTRDDSFLRDLWPHVDRAVAFIDSLRHLRMTPAYTANDSVRAYYGLMPESISHEGYSASPMHSFWDDLFVLRGLKDAVYIAETLGEAEAARSFAAVRDSFSADLASSYRRAMAMHGIDYLPGAVELGDFDPTSVTVAMDPADAEALLPAGALERTFERFWEGFVARRAAGEAGDPYTPYEWRNVGALVRLGLKARAHEALAWYFSHRRPAGWNAFAEVVDLQPRRPRFLGDIPHTWVGSDFIRAVTDLFAYEAGDRLVLGAGIPEAWARSATGVGVQGLRTRHGPLSYLVTAPAGGNDLVYVIDGGLLVPSGGLAVRSPSDAPAREVLVDGRPAALDADGSAVVRTLPARVVFRY